VVKEGVLGNLDFFYSEFHSEIRGFNETRKTISHQFFG